MHIFQIFDCHVCHKKAGKAEIRKHYGRSHQNVAFDRDLINFVAAIEEQFECNICNTVVVEDSRSQHRDKIHPERRNFHNLFTETTFDGAKLSKELSERNGTTDLGFVVDPTQPISLTKLELIENEWLERDKLKPKKRDGQCKICQIQLNPNIFVQHFVRMHSDEYKKIVTDSL